MTIDQQLIEKSSNFSIDRFQERKSTECSYLYFLSDFLLTELLEKLTTYITNEDLPWEQVARQEYANRRSVSWIPDSVVEETHMVFESITPSIENLLQRNQKFDGISIWKDQYPYQIKPHADQREIGSAIQIYLNSCKDNVVTSFSWGDSVLKPKNRANCGYFIDNHGQVIHWLESPVPKDFIRYSLYAIWKN